MRRMTKVEDLNDDTQVREDVLQSCLEEDCTISSGAWIAHRSPNGGVILSKAVEYYEPDELETHLEEETDYQDWFIHRYRCPDCGQVSRADRAIACFKCGAQMEHEERIGKVID